MARLVDCYPASDDDLPRLQGPLQLDTSRSRRPAAEAADKKNLVPKSTTTSSTRKVRRLGRGTRTATNPLFRPWNPDGENSSQASSHVFLGGSPKKREKSQEMPRCPQYPPSQSDQDSPPPPARPGRVRRQRANPAFHDESADAGLIEKQLSLQGKTLDEDGNLAETRKGAPIREAVPQTEAKAQDAVLISDNEESSVYQTAAEDTSEDSDGSASEFELDHSSDESFNGLLQPRMVTGKGRVAARGSSAKIPSLRESSQDRQTLARETLHNSKPPSEAVELSKALEKLQIHGGDFSGKNLELCKGDNLVLPSTPPKAPRPGSLVSPRKLGRIPQTPHRPSIDAFWSQDLIDDWNDRHSPTKPMLLPVVESPVKRSMAKGSPTKATKKSFDARKRLLAEEFLRELDTEITHGKIAELVESTGGVKLVWTKTLNTTAGRANWRRETTRTKSASGTPISVSHKHHASIELAEKIIDTEDRLLNVVAHEFCHLANFMVSGITNNPHGKEFKGWAAKCSRAFGDSRGIQVTTKHTYEIDFKYAWACTACGSEYKRHSKSIDPQRHRCGSCKSTLKQTKPVPRSAAGGGGGKPSDWQVFVKEQMKTVRRENPGSPQKEVMKIVAERWAKTKKGLVVADDAPSNVPDDA
ncbi:sprT-like family protein [Hirsutella rhossiliensis]|uniref:SprT-like family domain-containing protein n=1 Tax=Hirsutella rhossiliensis TaxID=111463 RepID=A0A9P8MQU8_9HYPO|nr:sprT-like family domain-containing protein [Hirsutella rhossiliensis]KAH0960098.1 sprT-like family domain-containing protein [Hirsutella rhossiliensis]